MPGAKRCLAHHQDEAPSYLQDDVGRSCQQAGGISRSDFRCGTNRTGRDNHSRRAHRAAGNRRPDIRYRKPARCKCANLLDVDIQFFLDRALASLAHDQKSLPPQPCRSFQQTNPIKGTRSTADPDDDRKAHVPIPGKTTGRLSSAIAFAPLKSKRTDSTIRSNASIRNSPLDRHFHDADRFTRPASPSL